METPVLSRNQQKKSLSAKKACRATIKNVLATPYRNYWPVLSSEDADTLVEALQTHLPLLNRNKAKVLWSEIKHVPRGERAEFRETYRKKNSEYRLCHTEDVVLGVNKVTKLLEKNAIACTLIAADVAPRLLVKHVVDMSILNATPVLIVPNLREVLTAKCGFSSVVFGLKNNIKNSHLKTLKETIAGISKDYPLPNYNLINWNRNLFGKGDNNHQIASQVTDVNMTKKTDVLLQRTDKSKRVFVPELSCDSTEKTKRAQLEVAASEFLSFEVGETTQKDDLFIPLTVKRLRNNKNRTRTKIEKLKKSIGVTNTN